MYKITNKTNDLILLDIKKYSTSSDQSGDSSKIITFELGKAGSTVNIKDEDYEASKDSLVPLANKGIITRQYIQDEFVGTRAEVEDIAGGAGNTLSNFAYNNIEAYPSKCYYVDVEGHNTDGNGSITKPYKTIEKALSLVNPTNLSSIIVLPGLYPENPFILPEQTTLKALGGLNSVVISAIDPNTKLVTLSPNSSISDVILAGVTNESAIYYEGEGLAAVKAVAINNCLRGLTINSIDSTVDVREFFLFSNAFTADCIICILNGNIRGGDIGILPGSSASKIIDIQGLSRSVITNITSSSPNLVDGITITGSGNLNITGLSLNGIPGNLINCGVYVSNPAMEVTLSTSFIGWAQDALVLEKGSKVIIKSLDLKSNYNNITIPDVGSKTELDVDGFISGSVENMSLNVLSPTAILKMSSGIVKETRVFVHPSANIIISGISDVERDQAMILVGGEFHVGRENRKTECCLGGGDNYTFGMIVVEWNGTTLTNISTIMADSEQNYSFPNNNVGTCLYVASNLQTDIDYVLHYGYKLLLNNVIDLGTGRIAIEYWNGTIWTEVKFGVIGGEDNFTPLAKKIFEDPYDEQVRINAYLVNDSWTKRALDQPVPDTIDRYYTRIIIKDNPINTSPVIDQIKIHSSHFEIEGDGFGHWFGPSRPIKNLGWGLGMLEGASNSPGDQDRYLSQGLYVGRKENAFANNSTQVVGFTKILPGDLDTSSPIALQLAFSPSNNDAGDITFRIKWGFSSPGSIIYNTLGSSPVSYPNEQSEDYNIAAPEVEGAETWFTALLDVSDMLSKRVSGYPDRLWVNISRVDGDPYGGIVYLEDLDGFYIGWSNGRHI